MAFLNKRESAIGLHGLGLPLHVFTAALCNSLSRRDDSIFDNRNPKFISQKWDLRSEPRGVEKYLVAHGISLVYVEERLRFGAITGDTSLDVPVSGNEAQQNFMKEALRLAREWMYFLIEMDEEDENLDNLGGELEEVYRSNYQRTSLRSNRHIFIDNISTICQILALTTFTAKDEQRALDYASFITNTVYNPSSLTHPETYLEQMSNATQGFWATLSNRGIIFESVFNCFEMTVDPKLFSFLQILRKHDSENHRGGCPGRLIKFKTEEKNTVRVEESAITLLMNKFLSELQKRIVKRNEYKRKKFRKVNKRIE